MTDGRHPQRGWQGLVVAAGLIILVLLPARPLRLQTAPLSPVTLASATNPVLRIIHAGNDPAAIAVDALHHRVFIFNQGASVAGSYATGPASINVLDATSGAVLHSFSLDRNNTLYSSVGGSFTSSGGSSLVVDARTNRLFVSTYDNSNASQPSNFRVRMLDATTGAVLRTVRQGGALAVDEATDRVFVGNDKFTQYSPITGALLDARTGAILRTLPHGDHLTVAPSLGRAYLADSQDVRILDATTGAVRATTHVVATSDEDNVGLTVDPGARRLIMLHTYGAYLPGTDLDIYDALSGAPVRLDTFAGGVFAAVDTRVHRVVAVDTPSSASLGQPAQVSTSDTRTGQVQRRGARRRASERRDCRSSGNRWI